MKNLMQSLFIITLTIFLSPLALADVIELDPGESLQLSNGDIVSCKRGHGGGGGGGGRHSLSMSLSCSNRCGGAYSSASYYLVVNLSNSKGKQIHSSCGETASSSACRKITEDFFPTYVRTPFPVLSCQSRCEGSSASAPIFLHTTTVGADGSTTTSCEQRMNCRDYIERYYSRFRL